jgi:hypothetical protein
VGQRTHEDRAQYGGGTKYFTALYKVAKKGFEEKETVAECENENGEPHGESGGKIGAEGGTGAEGEETSREITGTEEGIGGET